MTLDKAKAAAKRRKYYRKIDTAYRKALSKNPSASRILVGLQQSSNAKEIASLLAGTVNVGHEMRRVDAKKKWPTDLDVGSVYGEWQYDWGMKAVGAVGRATAQRDGLALGDGEDDGEFYRSVSNRLEAFAGETAMLNGETNLLHFLRRADPQEAAAFFQHILDAPA